MSRAEKIRRRARELGLKPPMDREAVPTDAAELLRSEFETRGVDEVYQALRGDPVGHLAARRKKADKRAAVESKRAAKGVEARRVMLKKKSAAARKAFAKDSKRPPSWKRPQLPGIRLAEPFSWIPAAIFAYVKDQEARKTVAIGIPDVIRAALTETLSKPRALLITKLNTGRGIPRTRLPVVRLPEGFEELPRLVEAACERAQEALGDPRISDGDVMRCALAQWLTRKGFGR